MNFLKKKLKPLTSGFIPATAGNVTTGSGSSKHNKANRDLEDDLYDEYVIEAPPHPSELLALGVDPTDIDVNDPEKLKELYRKAKEEGKDKKTNSVLLAKQRQKEEIEQKKKTREEWKFFDNLNARVEQVVKESQKNLEHLRESSAIDKLTEPDYELRLSADQVFKSSGTVKQEKSANNWIDFSEEDSSNRKGGGRAGEDSSKPKEGVEEFDEFGCPKSKRSPSEQAAIAESQKYIVEELLEDFGIDLRTADQKKTQPLAKETAGPAVFVKDQVEKPAEPVKKLDINLKAAARPRPRPNAGKAQPDSPNEPDPFDTSFAATSVEPSLLGDDPPGEKEEPSTIKEPIEQTTQISSEPVRALDPFDTSYVRL